MKKWVNTCSLPSLTENEIIESEGDHQMREKGRESGIWERKWKDENTEVKNERWEKIERERKYLT